MSKPLRILVADDHALFRKGITSVLSAYPNLKVVAEASNGEEAVNIAHEIIPDLILMDLSMPVMNGLEAIKKIKSDLPHIKIIILTISDDEADIFEGIRSGAQGYLIKNINENQLISIIKGVAQGEASFSGVIAAKILQEFQKMTQKQEEELTSSEKITEREREVLELIVQGLSNKEIAVKLNVSSGTIKNHVANILYKLHLKNRIEAAVYALNHGIGKPIN